MGFLGGVVDAVKDTISNPVKAVTAAATGGSSLVADAGKNVLGDALGGDKKAKGSKDPGSQIAQNPMAVAKIACKAAGLSEKQVPEVLATAKEIAPKNKKGKPELTVESITTAAQMVAGTNQNQKMGMSLLA